MSPPTHKTAPEETPRAAESLGSGSKLQNSRPGWHDLTPDALTYAANRQEVFPLTARKTPRFKSPHEPGSGCRGECGQLGHGFYVAAYTHTGIAGV